MCLHVYVYIYVYIYTHTDYVNYFFEEDRNGKQVEKER